MISCVMLDHVYFMELIKTILEIFSYRTNNLTETLLLVEMKMRQIIDLYVVLSSSVIIIVILFIEY